MDDDTKPAKRSTRARFLIVAGAVLALAFLGIAALQLPFVRNLALRYALSRLERSRIIAHAGSLEYNLATFSFHLTDITVATASDPNEPFFTAKDVRGSLARSTLLGRIALDEVAIDDSQVVLVRNGAGTANWPGSSNSSPPSSSSPPRVVVGHARVRNLVFRWQDPQSSADIAVSFELNAAGGDNTGHLVATRPGRIAWRDRLTSLEALDGQLSWNGTDLGMNRFSARLREGTLRADGRIEQLTGSPRLDMHVAADADLAALAPWFDHGRAISGTSHADVALAGPLSQPDARIALSGRNVSVEGIPTVSFEASARVIGRSAEITSLRGHIAGGSISATGQAGLEGPGVVSVEWQDVDLQSVLRDVLRRSASGSTLQAAARINGRIDARWTEARLEWLQLSAAVNASSGAATVRGALPLDGAARFDVRDLKWQMSTDDFGTTGARVNGNVEGTVNARAIEQSTIGGAIHVRADDARRLMAALAQSGVTRTAIDLGGTAAADFTVAGTVGALSLEGPVGATITYESLPAANVRARASMAPDGVRVTGLDAQLGGSSAQGGLAWTRGSDAIGGMLDASVAIADLSSLSAETSHVPLDGRIGISASLSGTGAHPRATIAANSAGLDVAGQHVDRAAADVTVDLAGSRIGVDRLTLQSGDGRLDGRGEIDLKRETYAAHADATNLTIKPVIGVAESNLPISARLAGSFDGDGSFRNLGGRGHVSLTGTRWKDADLGAIDADVTLSGRNAAVSVNARDLALAGDGTVSVDPPGALTFRGAWTPTDLAAITARVAPEVTTPISGSATVRFELNGTRDRLADTRTIVTIDALDAAVSRQTIRLARAGRLEHDGRTLRAGNIGLAAGMSTLTVDGSLGDRSSGLTATLDGSLGDFAFVRDLIEHRAAGATPLPLPAGSIQLRLSANGALAQPSITGTFQIVDGRIPLTPQQSVTGINMNARLADGMVTVESAAASFEGASLNASGRVPGGVVADRLPEALRRAIGPASGPATLSARVVSLTQAVLAPFVDPEIVAQVMGRVDATVQLEADRFSLDRLRGTVALDRADLSLGGTPFDQQVPTRVSVRDGRLTVDAWEWGRDDNRLVIRGGATLGRDSSLNLAATSVLDLRILNVLTPSARVLGRADSEIRLGGSFSAPKLDGWVTFSNGEARIANPRLIVSDVSGTVTLAADTLTVQRMFASVNGGDSEIAGTIRHHWFAPLGGRITLQTRSAALALEGLRAEANFDVALEADPNRLAVTGTVALLRSAFREQLSLTSGLIRALQAPVVSTVPAAPSPLDRLRLDVRIVTQDDLVVDNNYGQFTARADLRLVGTASRPSVTGRTTLGEGGSIYLGTRRYRLQEGGSIDFANPNRIEPDLNLTAVARVQSTDITLTLTGTPATLRTSLTSDNPQYTQNDLVSLLLVGQTASSATSGGVTASGTGLLGLLSGEFLNTAGRAVGLSTVRVENSTPDVRFDAGLVATETDPGTRLTIGRNIGSGVEVVFSQSLQQSGGLTWIFSYSPKSNLTMRVVSLDSGDRIYDFQHTLTFGRPTSFAKPVPRPNETVTSVQISGAGADEAALHSTLKLKEDDRFSFFRWQDDRERIENYYHDRDRLEARVTTKRMPDGVDSTRIALTYDVRPGPHTLVQVQGFELPASVIRDLKRAWADAVIDDLLREEAVRIGREALVDAGYVQASVTARIQRAGDEKQLSLLIETGTHAGRREVRFAGNRGVSTKRLDAVLSETQLARAVWIDPDTAKNALVAFYRADGYLNATVRIDPIMRSGDTAIRPVQVDEGEAFRVHDIRVDGAKSLSPSDVIAKAGLAKGEILTEAKMEQARTALDQSYRALGFNSVNVTLQSQTTPERPEADIAVRVDEGRQQRLRAITTKGVEQTRPALVSRALKLNVGDPVNLAAWNESRRRLYETGAFRSVDIEREVIEEPPAGAAAAAETAVEPVRALVTVQEWPRYRLRYGIELNDTAQSGDPSQVIPAFSEGSRTFSLGATGDLAARNLFGRALTAGLAARYTIDFRAARTYATAPTFFGRHITSTVFLERSNEGTGVTATGIRPAISTDKTTLTFEQRVRPITKMEVQYGYSIERNHTFELHPDPFNPLPFDITVTTAKLRSAVLIDMRNDVFDTASGWFHASSAEYAPDWLSPDGRVARYLAQQRYFHRTGRVVFASWGQIGLATAFDQELLPTDRFFAGGGYSVRGYAEQAISPRDVFGTVVGGGALMVFNQEVRFPLFPYVRGVGFVDAGRAFDEVAHLSFRDLAVGTGIGFRIQTPVVLLRVDMGIPLDDAYGPRRPRWFFSIGQMF